MPYASDRDRNPHDLELTKPAYPVAPLNLFLTSGYTPGVYDLCWDNTALSANSRFDITGVNIYRSFDSEFGPFERLTELPVGSTFWRDQTNNVYVQEETVEDSQWVLRGSHSATELSGPRYVFKTQHQPIVQEGSQKVPEWDVNAVRVLVDGEEAKVLRVVGETGEIELDAKVYDDVGTQTRIQFPVPTDTSLVQVSYRYNKAFVKTDLGTRVFYRVTTVGCLINADLDVPQEEDLLETPLERAVKASSMELEKTDYIWREAVRRNRWILQQGGERVKVFLRKTVGDCCPCVQQHTHKQPLNDCLDCFGVGILGGYEGPYDITIAPDDAERRISQKANGRTLEHTYEVWTSPSPLLSQRDFVVKVNGERYSIGGVRNPSNRGMMLQQHFNIGHFDEQDIRYQVPIDGVVYRNEIGPLKPPLLAPAKKTDKPNIPDERELRGRTKTWENIQY